MSGMTVRIRDDTHAALRELARDENLTLQEVLARAVEAYRRRLILDQTNAAYAALRSDPEQWREVLEERSILEGTLLDGLDDDPPIRREEAAWERIGPESRSDPQREAMGQ